MEKVNVYNSEGKIVDTINQPAVFKLPVRMDIIQKASEVIQSRKKQVQGRDPRAGLRNTAESWGTGHGISRAPRIKGSGFLTARNVGRVPFSKGGRLTHPIKVEKNIHKRINKTTRKLSILSSISATTKKEFIEKRGHLIENLPEIPFVLDDKIQTIKKTKIIFEILCNFGLEQELLKVKKSKKIRAGKGKRRGRRYKKRKGILLVIKEDFGIVKAARNIPGVEIKKIENLNIEDLAPGGHPGRITIWIQSAFTELNNYTR
ncbi:MAG: 50S ribosomal protein L4 [Promethearchaeota archaeon]